MCDCRESNPDFLVRNLVHNPKVIWKWQREVLAIGQQTLLFWIDWRLASLIFSIWCVWIDCCDGGEVDGMEMGGGRWGMEKMGRQCPPSRTSRWMLMWLILFFARMFFAFPRYFYSFSFENMPCFDVLIKKGDLHKFLNLFMIFYFVTSNPSISL